ncbi:substrate-binding domain-containing protein [Phormidesmis sp. 146-35]
MRGDRVGEYVVDRSFRDMAILLNQKQNSRSAWMLIRLKLREIAEQERFQFILFSDGEELAEGHLSAIPEGLTQAFEDWRQAYLGLDSVRFRLTPIPTRTNFSELDIAGFAKTLKSHLDEWLNGGQEWQKARERLAQVLAQNAGSEIRVLLDVKDHRLRRFPWQEWEFFEDHFHNAEIALCERFQPPAVLPGSGLVKILVVVGNTQNIEKGVLADLEAIKSVEKNGAVVEILEQPSRHTLLEKLRTHPYEIFIFTGHSSSNASGEIGKIALSDTDDLEIGELKQALRSAIAQRLQLCIFNSCDGLGLSRQLAELKLPCTIVMREPVPDDAAAKFLKVFLKSFAEGRSFFRSFREARQRLEGFNQYPGVCWLPAISIGQSVQPPTWEQLAGKVAAIASNPLPKESGNRSKKLILGSIAVLGLVAGGVWFLNRTKPQIPALEPSPGVIEISQIQFPAMTVKYGGSGTLSRLANGLKVLPGVPSSFNLDYVKPPEENGSEVGIQMLIDGELDIALSSTQLETKDYDRAAQKQVRIKQVAIAIDGIAVVVNPSLNLDGLTIGQLKDIYTGKITNWQQINPSLPSLTIQPFSNPPQTSGTAKDFKEKVLGNEDFKIPQENYTRGSLSAGIARVADAPGGIYYATASEAVRQCTVKPISVSPGASSGWVAPYQGNLGKRGPACTEQDQNKVNVEAFQPNGQYPERLTRRLYAIVRQDNDPQRAKRKEAGEALIKLLQTQPGQELIRETGFYPLQAAIASSDPQGVANLYRTSVILKM